MSKLEETADTTSNAQIVDSKKSSILQDDTSTSSLSDSYANNEREVLNSESFIQKNPETFDDKMQLQKEKNKLAFSRFEEITTMQKLIENQLKEIAWKNGVKLMEEFQSSQLNFLAEFFRYSQANNHEMDLFDKLIHDYEINDENYKILHMDVLNPDLSLISFMEKYKIN